MGTAIIILDDLAFEELKLEQEAISNRLLFATAPLYAPCRANGLDPNAILAEEDTACWLICEWYVAHRIAGGEPDTVAEKILAEVAAAQASEIPVLKGGAGLEH